MKRQFDAKLWKTGNAIVVTIPYSIIEKFKLKKGELVEITIKKDGNKKVNK
ncbi:MAG: AbrB/MazE/SpoVT family DNA-binding domain-containing protein [Nanoarchaeota archaeon]